MNRNDRVGFVAQGMVPVPNCLFDELLPRLKDTELRVLLVVLRQTLGFREGSPSGGWRYKRRDWISHSQLQKKTGRGSDAISRAVDAVVQQGLIVVEDAAGKPLATPEQRRRHLGRLFYRPGDNLATMGKTGDSCRPAKAETTTDKENNINIKNRHITPVRGGGWQRVLAVGDHP